MRLWLKRLSRKHGGLRILPPFSYARRGGDYRGPMDALAGVSDYLNNIRQDYVILGRGDVALNLPVADVFQQHLDSGADVTVVCTPTLRGAPRSSEYVEVSESGRITDLSIHPIAAGDQLESLELYVLSKQLLLSMVDYCAAHDVTDFSRGVLQPRLGSGYSYHSLSHSRTIGRCSKTFLPQTRKHPVKYRLKDHLRKRHKVHESTSNCP